MDFQSLIVAFAILMLPVLGGILAISYLMLIHLAKAMTGKLL